MEDHQKSDGNGKISRLENLREKFKKVQAQIDQLEAKDKAKARKEDTRLKVLIGAAHLADAQLHEETRRGISAVLERAITAQHDREFLKHKGWL